MDRGVFCSWSGGKDSCLALHRAVQQGARPRFLITMFTEGGERSRSHGLDREIIQAQAKAMGIKLVVGEASWQNYESVFGLLLKQMQDNGAATGVFGDIDIEEHRAWVQNVCASQRVTAWHPLWQEQRITLLHEFINLGYRAKIVSARDELADLLGREFDAELVAELEARNVEPCGEQGEFHTVVTDGPLFSQAIVLKPGKAIFRDGYSFLDYKL